jgi:hypothetical protein
MMPGPMVLTTEIILPLIILPKFFRRSLYFDFSKHWKKKQRHFQTLETAALPSRLSVNVPESFDNPQGTRCAVFRAGKPQNSTR